MHIDMQVEERRSIELAQHDRSRSRVRRAHAWPESLSPYSQTRALLTPSSIPFSIDHSVQLYIGRKYMQDRERRG